MKMLELSETGASPSKPNHFKRRLEESLDGSDPRTSKITKSPYDRALKWLLFVLYVSTVTWITAHHEMNRDEVQPFLIDRDAPSLFSMLHRLAYEGHPSLWYLVLWVPAKLSSNPVSEQVINNVFAAAEAFLLLSFRKAPLILRALMLFSLTLLYSYGVIARNYMLAGLLLTGAMALLLRRPSRPWPAVFLLALAIQTHFFALPIAFSLFAVLLCFDSVPGAALRGKQLGAAALVLLASTFATYETIKPPPDTQLKAQVQGSAALALIKHFAAIAGKAWQVMLPIPKSRLPASLAAQFVSKGPTMGAFLLSAVLLSLGFFMLRSRPSRWLFALAVLLEIGALTITVHQAPLRHYEFITLAWFFGILLDFYVNTKQTAPAQWVSAYPFLLGMLGLQAVAGVSACVLDWKHPYSAAKETSQWLLQQGLADHPLVVMPDESVPGITAYLRLKDAYLPACRCFDPTTFRKGGRELDRMVSPQELATLTAKYHKPPVVLSGRTLSPVEVAHLKLRLVASFDQSVLDPAEMFYVYVPTNAAVSSGRK